MSGSQHLSDRRPDFAQSCDQALDSWGCWVRSGRKCIGGGANCVVNGREGCGAGIGQCLEGDELQAQGEVGGYVQLPYRVFELL